MKRKIFTLQVVCVAALAAISMACPVLAGNGNGENGDLASFATPEMNKWDGDMVDVQSESVLSGIVYGKIDAALLEKIESRLGNVSVSSFSAAIESPGAIEERAHIQILASEADIESSVSALLALGGEITGTITTEFGEDGLDPGILVVQGWVPFQALEELSSNDAVRYVRAPLEALMIEEDSGTPFPESFDPSAWHNAGLRGGGIKIGIIDSGFADDGPTFPSGNVNWMEAMSFVDGDTDNSMGGDSSQGTKSLRIIQEIAPDVEFYTARVETLVDVAEAVSWLVNDVGVQIIRTPVVPFHSPDGKTIGDLAASIIHPFQSDVYWATPDAAIRDRFRFGPFEDQGDGYHLFFPGRNVTPLPYADDSEGFLHDSHSGLYLGWTCPVGAKTDLDLYLLRWDGFQWQLAGESRKTQPEELRQFQLEYLSAPPSVATTLHGLAVRGDDIREDLYFDLFTTKGATGIEDEETADATLTSSGKAGIAALIMGADASIGADQVDSAIHASLDDSHTPYALVKGGTTESLMNKSATTDCPMPFEHDFQGLYNGSNDWQDLPTDPIWEADKNMTVRSLIVETTALNVGLCLRVLVDNHELDTWAASEGAVLHKNTVSYDILDGDEITLEYKNGDCTENPQNPPETGSFESPVFVCFSDQFLVGSLQVTINPQGAIDAGAQWRIDIGDWQNSGATVGNLPVGNHTVSFKAIDGWNTPEDEPVDIGAGATTCLTKSYTRQTGSLIVNLYPQEAVCAGAQWRIDGGDWQDSGKTVTGLIVGDHIISFGAIDGWDPPGDKSVPIANGTTTTDNGTYTPHTGNSMLTQGKSGNVGVGASYPEEKLVLSKGNFLQNAGGLKHMGAITDDETTVLDGASSIYVSGKYAYVASQTDNGVEILDISDPSNPTHVGAITDNETTELEGARGIYVSGKYAYIASIIDDGVEILDISDPSNPTHVGAITDDETTKLDGARSIHVSGKYAYVAAVFDNGVEILDISDPSNPTHAGAISDDETTELFYAHSIYVSGKYAYVAAFIDDGVEILDISDPSNPTHVGAISDDETTQLNGAAGIYVSGKYAYVASILDSGVEILDISDPSNPTHVGAISDDETTALNDAQSIHVSGKYAYVAAAEDNGVELLDISDPSNPTHVSAIRSDDTTKLVAPYDIHVSGKYAYVAAYLNDSVEVLDISGVDAPVASIGSIATDSLDVSKSSRVGNNFSVGGGVNVGMGGIYSAGPFSAQGAVSIGGDLNVVSGADFGDELNALSRISINGLLKLTPRESPPDSPADGYVYYDQTDQNALCVYMKGAWVKIAGAGNCQ